MIVCHMFMLYSVYQCGVFFFQAEDGIRDLVRSRGLGDVYKRQHFTWESLGQKLRQQVEAMILAKVA